jgi:hypothetical protein
VSYLRRLIAGLSNHMRELAPGSVRTGSVVDKVTPGGFLRVIWLCPINIIPPRLPILIYHQKNEILLQFRHIVSPHRHEQQLPSPTLQCRNLLNMNHKGCNFLNKPGISQPYPTILRHTENRIPEFTECFFPIVTLGCVGKSRLTVTEVIVDNLLRLLVAHAAVRGAMQTL